MNRPRQLPILTKEDFDEHGLIPMLPEKFDNSATKGYICCPRYFYLTYVLGRRPPGKALALNYGSTWHAMHDLYGKTGDLDRSLDVADEMLPEEIDDRFGRGRSQIKEFFLRHISYYMEIEQRMELIMSEQPGEAMCLHSDDCVFGGCGLYHGGKMDRLYRYNGRLWILDFKTSVYEDKNFANKLTIDPQTIGYAWIYSHLVGEQVWGVIIDRTVMNKSVKEPFKRYPQAFSEGRILQWIADQQEIQQDINRRWGQFPYDMSGWPKNPEHCWRYASGCDKWPVCTTSEPKAQLIQLATEYVEGRHDFYNL